MIASPYHAVNRRVELALIRSGAPVPLPAAPTAFHPGVNHGHTPSGRWAEVQANPNSPGASISLIAACKIMQPRELVATAIMVEFKDKPIALEHLNWYLANGSGRDFVEDDNVKTMLERDSGVRAAIASNIPRNLTSGKFAKQIKLEQKDYANQDLLYAFGAIDILDFEADFDRKTIHIWFQDRYEWHPVYSGLYTALPGDGPRETNCVHAALVELKSSGAADFWMKGETTVPLSLIVSTTRASSTSTNR